MENDTERMEGVCKSKLVQLRNVCKKYRKRKMFQSGGRVSEFIKNLIQKKSKDIVIQIIKEKENLDLMYDTVDKRKCMIIYGLQDKKNSNKCRIELVREII